MYEYKALVTKVYDADTITVDIDLGFGVVLKKQKIRLKGINAPEVRGAERKLGIISRDELRKRILDKQVIIKTYRDKKGKYGRWLASVHVSGSDESINDWLIKEGLAEIYK
mgnify:CR=1 FL=1|tara:strand:+ start:1016 stop:1348 length:333 start_codon:yes stop_codon:yes gene_type:complete